MPFSPAFKSAYQPAFQTGFGDGGLTYTLADRALDLGNLEPFTIPDLSGNANTATLYSGIYVSTNGSTDKAINADCSAAGVGFFRITGWIKPDETTAWVQTNDDTSVAITGLTIGVWQEFSVNEDSNQAPSMVRVGHAYNDDDPQRWTSADWSDIRLWRKSGINGTPENDTLVERWPLFDSAASDLDGFPALGVVNGYHGTHVGCAGGSGEPDILQTAGEDFNKRMWFDGVDGSITVTAPTDTSGGIEVTIVSVNSASLTFNTFVGCGDTAGTNNRIIFGQFAAGGATDRRINYISINSSGLGYRQISNDPIDLTSGDIVKVTVVDGTSITLMLNGNVIPSTTDISDDTPKFFGGISGAKITTIGARQSNGALGAYLVGIISDVKFLDASDDVTAEHQGHGNTDTDWNGTVNGSPSLYHVAESETTAGQDALGNAIENPRPNERVLNLTTGTGYAEIADSASLDLTTAATWEVWGNFADKQTNNQEAYLAKYNAGGNQRSWNIAYNPFNQEPDEISMAFGDPLDGTLEGLVKISVPNEIASVVFTYNNGTLVAYVNGSSVGTTVVIGSVPVTLHQNNEPVIVGSSGDDLPAATQIGDIRIYDRALTADEVLKNYNARKGAYGL